MKRSTGINYSKISERQATFLNIFIKKENIEKV